MRNKILILIVFILYNYTLQANILCPPDKYLTCHDDIYYLPLVGTPTILSGFGQLRYFDQNNTNMCNVGHIVRTWYLDANNNQSFDNYEDACVQNIYVEYTPGTIEIYWPKNVEVECTDAIPYEPPFWTSGPCDMLGVSKRDEILNTGNNACFKIMRHFTVINWCTYIPGTSIGEWKYTQMITINDKTRPNIQHCGEVIIGTDIDCKATFTVSNSAVDISPCGDQILYWKAEVDLWNDDVIDYTYASDHIDPRFKLKTTLNGELVSLTLPDLVKTGWHRVTWTVYDQCGNASKCVQKVHVKDTKKPTPYMYEILSAAFEGKSHPLNVVARQFNLGSFDNCTKQSLLRYSFSKDVNDTIRVINCNNAGFQFYTIYVTDLEGNQEFAEVFLLAFDNGACSNMLQMRGVFTEGNHTPITGAQLMLTRTNEPTMEMMAESQTNGLFEWKNISLYQDMVISPSYNTKEEGRVDIADLKMLQDYILGSFSLNDYQFVAADVDGDGNIKARDLIALKDIILGKSQNNASSWIITSYLDSIVRQEQLSEIYRENTIRLNNMSHALKFIGIYRGDISGANDIVVEERKNTVLRRVNTENSSAFYLDNHIELAGIQLELSNVGNTNIEVSSPYFDIPQDAIHVNAGSMKIVILKDFVAQPETPLFIISGINAGQNQISLSKGSRVLLPGYETRPVVEKRTERTDTGIVLTPNPAKDYFEIAKGNVHIVNICNHSGIAVPFVQNENKVEWLAPSGVYFVTMENQGRIIVQKLIKL